MSTGWTARGTDVCIDPDGDVRVTFQHQCGCCYTQGCFTPDQADAFADAMKYAAAAGRAQKRTGMAVPQEGRA